MKIVEFYAGSRSIGKVAEKYGCEVFSTDITQFGGIDLVIDAEEVTVGMLPFIPDMIWFGIPCTSWSLAGISHHRKNGTEAFSDFAIKSDRLLEHNLNLIKELTILNPNLIWYFENPRGCLRKMPQMQGLPRTTIWYCTYGDIRAKPTDIWSNNIYNPLFNSSGWKPRPQCFNGNKKCHHESAPRGSRIGTQGLKNNHERSKMPEQLCEELIRAIYLKTTYN